MHLAMLGFKRSQMRVTVGSWWNVTDRNRRNATGLREKEEVSCGCRRSRLA